jgi:hypothetical protein
VTGDEDTAADVGTLAEGIAQNLAELVALAPMNIGCGLP